METFISAFRKRVRTLHSIFFKLCANLPSKGSAGQNQSVFTASTDIKEEFTKKAHGDRCIMATRGNMTIIKRDNVKATVQKTAFSKAKTSNEVLLPFCLRESSKPKYFLNIFFKILLPLFRLEDLCNRKLLCVGMFIMGSQCHSRSSGTTVMQVINATQNKSCLRQLGQTG